MSRCRLLFAWLLLAAIPLQGFAAASMLYCGMGTLDTAHVHAQAGDSVADGGHEHASHALQLPDSSHKCGVCASCCNGVAITGMPRPVAIVPLPPADAAEPFVLIHPRPSTVPDKPPRA